MKLTESFQYKTEWLIRKFADDGAFFTDQPFEEIRIDGNLLLNEGITALLTLLTGGGGTAFNNAGSYIGVGDSTTAEAASQTGLSAATNKLYVGMAATYPIVAAQTVTFRSVFAAAQANWAWQEFSVANGSSDAATNLNRKVSNQGTKVNGQVWTVDVAITIS